MAAYTGPLPYNSAGVTSAVDVSDTSFAGKAINNGTISPSGIAVISSSIDQRIEDVGGWAAGRISVNNAGVLSATAGIRATFTTKATFFVVKLGARF